MTTTPTLDPERTDRLRTFLVTEAAASTVAGPSPSRLTPALRRSLVAGALGATLVAGGVAVATTGADTDAPTRAAAPDATTTDAPVTLPDDLQTIAVERADGWTTLRLTDIDADPAAVVADLQAAGFTVEQQNMDVIEGPNGERTIGADGSSTDAIGMFAVGSTAADGSVVGGSLAGLSVAGDDLWIASPTPGSDGPLVAVPADGGASGQGPAAGAPDADAEAGVEDHPNTIRFGNDGSISIRDGAEVAIVVYTAE